MTKIADSSGALWALLSTTDSSGRTYIRAYQNAWNAEKKRSFVKSRIQVGRLRSDGSVALSEGFKESFPSFADTTWYWGDHALLSEEEFRQQFPQKDSPPDLSWSNEVIRFGSTWAAWETAVHRGILEDLEVVFGNKTARQLLALAVYKFDGGGAMMTFEDWLPQVWLPEIEPLNGRRISELLSKVSVSLTENYYKRRYDRASERSKDGMTLSFDSTSISTYSSGIVDAAWGHAKQNPQLRQVNYLVVCDHATGDVVYAFSYDGSVNDKTILAQVYLQMQSAGLNLANNILVTDRGFQSIWNTQTAINLDLKYIQFLSLNEGVVREALRRKMLPLSDPTAHRDPELCISALSVEDLWTQATDAGPVTIKGPLHLYRDAITAQEDADALHRDILYAVKVKNEQEKTPNGKTKRLDETLWKRVKPFLYENKHPKDGDSVWSIRDEKLREAVRFMGCRAIRTNAVSNPFEALCIYRQRDIIEQGFNQLKNEVGGSRLVATETTYRGKLFIFSLAQSIRMSMLRTAAETVQKNPKLKMPEESLCKLIVQLQGLQARKHRTTDAFIVGIIPKRYRDLLTLIGITKLPRTLYRYVSSRSGV